MRMLEAHSTPYLESIVNDLSGFYTDSEWHQANAELLYRIADAKGAVDSYVHASRFNRIEH